MFVKGTTTMATWASLYWNPDLSDNVKWNAVYSGSDFRGK